MKCFVTDSITYDKASSVVYEPRALLEKTCI